MASVVMAARVGVADLRRELEVVAYDDVGHAHKEQDKDEIQHGLKLPQHKPGQHTDHGNQKNQQWVRHRYQRMIRVSMNSSRVQMAQTSSMVSMKLFTWQQVR